MPKIELNKIEAGDLISATSTSGVNDDISRWNAAVVNGDNVREEGIDRRNFENGVFVEPTSSAMSGTHARFSSPVTVNANAAGFSSLTSSVVTGALIGPIHHDPTNDAGLKVNVSFQYETPLVQTTNSTAPHFSLVRPNWNVQLAYRTGSSSGIYTAIAGTKRQLSIEIAETVDSSGTTLGGYKWIDSMTIVHALNHSGAASDYYFQLFAWEDGSGLPLDLKIDFLNMFATRYKR